jgi:hypothetical protein
MVWQAPWQPKDCGVLAVRVQPCSGAGDESSADDCQGGGCGGGGCRPHVTLAAVHCSASLGVAYCTGARQQPRPAVPAGPQKEALEQQQQQQAAGAGGGRVNSQARARAGPEPGARAVHVQFLRQAVPDAARPAICSFAALV